jgi:protein-disulfide isomerase
MIASPFRRGALLVALLAALSASAAAQTFKASAVEGQASIADGLARVTFKIEIANDGSSPMTNVVVVFADNTEVTLGDIAGEATVTSDTQSRTIDIADSTSRTVVMNVTLKYAIDGENVEVPWILSVLAE